MLDYKDNVKLKEFLKPKQQEAFDLVTADGCGGCVFSRVGTGKTRIALLAAAQILGNRIRLLRGSMIVVYARRKAFYDWQVEVEKLGMACNVVILEDVRNGQAFEENTIILASHGRLISKVAVATLQSLMVDFVIIDESYLFCNPQSQRSKTLAKLHPGAPRITISGSLMPARDLIQIYGQVQQAGRGDALAKHSTAFRSKYQVGIQGGFYSYSPKKGAYKAVMDAIAPFTFVWFPPKSAREIKESIIRCPMYPTQAGYVKELKATYAIEGHFELKSAATVVQKAQQISNGWFLSEDETYVSFPSGKVDRCVALVEEIISSGDKVLVWCAFRNDIKRLKEAMFLSAGCVKAGIATLQGGEDFDITHWQKPSTMICLATEASGSSINHFGQVPNAIYFSQDYKWLNLQQSMGRTDRDDSLHKTCFYSFLHSDGSMDSRVHYTVKKSAQTEASVIRQMGVDEWLKT